MSDQKKPWEFYVNEKALGDQLASKYVAQSHETRSFKGVHVREVLDEPIQSEPFPEAEFYAEFLGPALDSGQMPKLSDAAKWAWARRGK